MTILDQSLGQLARELAGATAGFRKYQLDFCCGGQQRLGVAERGHHAVMVEDELTPANMTDDDWAAQTDTQLIHLENNIVFDRVGGQLRGENHG